MMTQHDWDAVIAGAGEDIGTAKVTTSTDAAVIRHALLLLGREVSRVADVTERLATVIANKGD